MPPWEDDADRTAALDENWPILFELMLECWITDEPCWPEPRTREMFDQWFEILAGSPSGISTLTSRSRCSNRPTNTGVAC